MTLPKILLSTPHFTKDGSHVTYFLKNGVEWVKHTKNGITRYAEYENGSWIDENTFLNM